MEKRTKNNGTVRKKDISNRTYRSPDGKSTEYYKERKERLELERVESMKADKGKAEMPEKLTKKSKKDK